MTFLFRSPEGPPLIIFLLFSFCLSHTPRPPSLLVLFGRALLPHTLTHLHINKMTMTSPRGNVTWRASKTKQKSTPFARRLSCVVCRGCRLSCVAGSEFAPLIFCCFWPSDFGPPCSPLWILRCVEAEGKGKGKKEKRGKRTGKTDVSARVFRGDVSCSLLAFG